MHWCHESVVCVSMCNVEKASCFVAKEIAESIVHQNGTTIDDLYDGFGLPSPYDDS